MYTARVSAFLFFKCEQTLNEPTQIQSGDTIKWSESFSDYSASSGWALTYYIRGNANLNVSGVANGTGFDITITAAQSATLSSGIYSFVGKVSKDDEVFTVTSGAFDVLPNLAEVEAGYEARTHAQIALEKIEQCIEKILSDENASASFNGVSYSKQNLPELKKLQYQYQSDLKREKNLQRIKNGMTANNAILGRFTAA